jgi:hypothetical protein
VNNGYNDKHLATNLNDDNDFVGRNLCSVKSQCGINWPECYGNVGGDCSVKMCYNFRSPVLGWILELIKGEILMENICSEIRDFIGVKNNDTNRILLDGLGKFHRNGEYIDEFGVLREVEEMRRFINDMENKIRRAIFASNKGD